MMSSQKIQTTISYILLFGILISTSIVIVGGFLYLYQHGHELLSNTLQLQSEARAANINQIWHVVLSFSPVGLIELGLLLLVITQILRVALLTWFYIATVDYWFTLTSIFILLFLIYSLFWRH